MAAAASLAVADEFRILTLPTEYGPMEARLFDAGATKSGAIFVGGTADGFVSPANGLYGRLGFELARSGVSCLWVRYRRIEGAAGADGASEALRVGIGALAGRGIARIGLVGHAQAGAAAIRTAEIAREVKAIVALAVENNEMSWAPTPSPRPLLLVHGTADEKATPSASVEIFRLAREPKELRLIDGAGHEFDESPGTVHLLVRAWLERWLAGEVIPITSAVKQGSAG